MRSRFSPSSCPASLLAIALNLVAMVLIIPFVGCNNGAEVSNTPAPLPTDVVPPVLMITEPTGAPNTPAPLPTDVVPPPVLMITEPTGAPNTPAPLPTDVVPPPVLMITEPTGLRRNAKDVAEIQEVVPFNVVIPQAEDLPGDFYISGISVHPNLLPSLKGVKRGKTVGSRCFCFSGATS